MKPVGKEQARANSWWSDLHPYSRVHFTTNRNPTDKEILEYYKQNEANNPANKSMYKQTIKEGN